MVVDCFDFEPSTTLGKDGSFEIGDVASIKSEGFLTIRDRAKHIIKSGGEWISTVELEGTAMGTQSLPPLPPFGTKKEMNVR